MPLIETEDKGMRARFLAADGIQVQSGDHDGFTIKTVKGEQRPRRYVASKPKASARSDGIDALSAPPGDFVSEAMVAPVKDSDEVREQVIKLTALLFPQHQTFAAIDGEVAVFRSPRRARPLRPRVNAAERLRPRRVVRQA